MANGWGNQETVYTNRRAIAFGNFLSKTREIHFSERLKALFVYRFKVIKDKRISDSVINKSSNPPVINGHLIFYAYYVQFDAFFSTRNPFLSNWRQPKSLTRARGHARSTYRVEFPVKSTRVANWVSVLVAPPECSLGGMTISTRCPSSAGCRLFETKKRKANYN